MTDIRMAAIVGTPRLSPLIKEQACGAGWWWPGCSGGLIDRIALNSALGLNMVRLVPNGAEGR